MPTSTPFANLITFSRGTNATVVGPDGLVQWAPSNLLTFSEQFDNAAWVTGLPSPAPVTANTFAAPDGTTTADTIAPALATPSRRNQSAVTSGATYTASIWVRAAPSGSATHFRITSNNTVAWNTGASTKVALTTSWQRVSVTWTQSGSSLANIVIGASDVAGVNDADCYGNVLVWGAQLELGSTATTYNPTTVKNLLGFSEAFDNAAWTKTRASIVTGAAANPINGLFNAQKLMEDTSASNTHIARQTVSNVPASPVVFSVYVKAAGRSFVRLVDASYGNGAYFNLANATVGTTDSATGSITDVGNGWYRCSLFYTSTVAGSHSYDIRVANAATGGSDTYTGDGNSGIYIYGAQLSDSASLDPYVPTPGAAPSSTAYYGPRFDYDPATLQPRGILIEEQRTNLFTNSEFPNGVSDAPTRGGNVSATTFSLLFGNTGLAINNTGPVTSFAYKTNFTTVVSTTYTFSAFVRMDDGNAPSFGSSSTTSSLNSFVLVLANSGVDPTTYTVTAMGNGFYRVSATATAGSAFVNNGIVKYDTNDSRPFTVSGYQLEVGAFATSYIPTIASTVTRSADVATISGALFAPWFSQSAGTFVFEGTVLAAATAEHQTGFNIANGSFPIVLRFNDRFGAGMRYLNSDASLDIAIPPVLTANVVNKGATAYSGANDAALCRNGGTVGIDTSYNASAGNTAVFLGSNSTGSGAFLNGHIRSIRYIPVRAADFQLQALTT